VLALDVDTVPGLSISLGAPIDAGRLPSGLAELVESKEGRRWKVVKGAGPVALVSRYAVPAADGIQYLQLGKLPGRVEPSVTIAFRHVMEGFRRPGWIIVADLAAGTRQAMFGWARFAAVRIVVVEPSAKSIISGRRLLVEGTHLLVNKVRSAAEIEIVKDAIALPLVGAIPYDEDVTMGEQQGTAPIEFAPQSPAVEAIGDLARRLENGI